MNSPENASVGAAGGPGSAAGGVTGEQSSGADLIQSLVDLDDQAGKETIAGSGATGQESGAAAFELLLDLPPDTVVASVEGKPLTVGELSKSVMLQSDYTRKTQELSQRATDLDVFANFVDANRAVFEDIDSGDPERITRALIAVGAAHNINLAVRGKNGRFEAAPGSGGSEQASAIAEAEQYLEDMIEEHGEDSREARHAQAALDQLNRMGKIIGQLEGAAGRIGQREATERAREQASLLAQYWSERGLNGVDIEGALRLVGSSMSIEHAMLVQNWNTLMRHQFNAGANRKAGSGRTPTEPGSASRGAAQLEGKTLGEAFAARGFG